MNQQRTSPPKILHQRSATQWEKNTRYYQNIHIETATESVKIIAWLKRRFFFNDSTLEKKLQVTKALKTKLKKYDNGIRMRR